MNGNVGFGIQPPVGSKFLPPQTAPNPEFDSIFTPTGTEPVGPVLRQTFVVVSQITISYG